MGQKVHPLGFRVGITKKHQSQWFARFHKNSYSQSILEDRMLRNTLIKLFPDLLNPVLKKIQNRQQETKITPKITQIKIERGLIPYEIGIQIHAQNCELIKSAIDKLKINRDLACYLQKTQKFLTFLGQRAKLDVDNSIAPLESSNVNFQDTGTQQILGSSPDGVGSAILTNFERSLVVSKKKTLKRIKIRGLVSKSTFSRQTGAKKNLGRKTNTSFKKRSKRGSKLTKEQYQRKKLIQRRLRRRENLRFRFNEFISKGLLINKKKIIDKSIQDADGNAQNSKSGLQIIQRKIKSKKKILNRFKQNKFIKSIGKTQSQIKDRSSGQKTTNRSLPGNGNNPNFSQSNLKGSKIPFQSSTSRPSLVSPIGTRALGDSQSGRDRKAQVKDTRQTQTLKKNPVFIRIKKKIQKKFLTIYLDKMNKNFLKNLKQMMKFWQLQSINNEGAPKANNFFGYSQKWDLQKLNSFKNQPIPKLMKLIQILEKKIGEKMEGLKKYFIIFGCLSKTQAYSFYQIMTFLKSLKAIVRQRFIRLRLGITSQVLAKYTSQKKESKTQSSLVSLKGKSSLQNSNMKTKKVLLKIVNNLDDECRKIKFIEYLKQTLQKHRTKNIFYYLSTLAKATKDLKQTKNFTIKNAQFLFGLDLQDSTSGQEENVIKDRVTRVLEQSNRNKIYGGQDFEQALRDSLINQIEKQKLISKENLKLTPKISIKFYSVKKESLEIKASVAAESIVDALEKRKAFRKVIKDAKENLMKKQRVKGVKIQVAGRLNGAEIARTEWVRAGRVPLQTLRANIDFSYQTANTIYGIIGVKVWIFKGYTKTI
jgi:ribosomal protein S3